ncbi:glycoside hydrolase family 53 protein [Aquabacterium sp. OR-4]|uniref:glycoside hydrolase family 53 protein n=1 Tax=Aquabacterium sp. OR-4 TaxID=2978127 RepID=UPI0028C837ED|nr:glycosyl hydrolase 53 family protein [Aquabacterium sp. OR-4]MDT7838487.1 glycosyl hydrolase 53 family protein [Aquabacterium sp. OR-4]
MTLNRRQLSLGLATAAWLPGQANANANANACPPAVTQHARGFIVGADVSMLEAVEHGGGRFADAQGRPAEALGLLHGAGFDWGRLRLWHTPVNADDVREGERLVSRRGEPVGGGSNDLALTIRLARRLRQQGMKWLLDIHYSDFWADPAHQRKPQAWRTLSGTALADAVQAYTTEVLLRLHEAGVTPDMVQLGNEINGGMLWPDGKTWRETPDEAIGGMSGFLALMAAAVRGWQAAEARIGQRVPVMVHLAHQGDGRSRETFERMFDALRDSGARMDVIGLSWYPYFHDDLASLRANLQHLSARYGKPLVVVETAYGWQLDHPVGGAAIFNAEAQRKSGYPATPAGQQALLQDVARAVADTPQGLGVFYWEPAWLAVPGAGWRTNDINGWANQTLFDARGRALPGLQALRAAAPRCR